jgi:hypothetical protein
MRVLTLFLIALSAISTDATIQQEGLACVALAEAIPLLRNLTGRLQKHTD